VTYYLSSIFNISVLSENEKWLLKNLACLPVTFHTEKDIISYVNLHNIENEPFSEIPSSLISLTKKGWLTQKKNEFNLHRVLGNIVVEINPIKSTDIIFLEEFVSLKSNFNAIKTDNIKLEKSLELYFNHVKKWIPFMISFALKGFKPYGEQDPIFSTTGLICNINFYEVYKDVLDLNQFDQIRNSFIKIMLEANNSARIYFGSYHHRTKKVNEAYREFIFVSHEKEINLYKEEIEKLKKRKQYLLTIDEDISACENQISQAISIITDLCKSLSYHSKRTLLNYREETINAIMDNDEKILSLSNKSNKAELLNNSMLGFKIEPVNNLNSFQKFKSLLDLKISPMTIFFSEFYLKRILIDSSSILYEEKFEFLRNINKYSDQQINSMINLLMNERIKNMKIQSEANKLTGKYLG